MKTLFYFIFYQELFIHKLLLSYTRQIMKDVVCTTYVEVKRKAERRAEWRAAANQSLN
jgi:hypothetical protein